MASTYSSNLKIELMATGSDSGTWGTNTNTNLGTAIEQAIIGYGNPDYTSDANLTITITNSSASQAARCLVLNVTSVFGSLTATRELIVPTIQKQYIVQNNTTGGQSITVKTSAGTGITVPTGRKAHLYVDGTNVIQMFDFVDINGGAIDGTPIGAASASTGAFTTLNASGATTLDGTVALGNASGDLITVPGTVNSNLIFTDNLFDIGASGATRPRNLFLAGAATVGGNLSVGGTLTLTGGVNLNGNVTVGDTSADTLTINSTITSNLIFTDNTYDIGASGATRPRNLFLAGNATVGGAQTLTGALTVDSTTDSTSITTGSIQTDGGLGVAKALFVGTTTNMAGALTYGGVTLNNAVTGTGNMVLSTSPTLVTPTLGVATATSLQGIIGNVTPAAGAFTTVTASSTLGVTGVATFSAGTAALPALTTTNDTNTGIFFPAADTIAFAEGGAEAMRITDAGNLLLGSTVDNLGGNRLLVLSANTTPNFAQRVMTVYNTAATSTTPFENRILQLSSNAGGADVSIGFTDSVSNNASFGMGGGALYFSTGGAANERMRITSTGDVGIGTSSPAAVTGFSSSRTVVQVTSSNGYGQLRLGGASGTLIDHDNASTTATTIRNLYGATSNDAAMLLESGYIAFRTGTSYTERARIDSSGNVGIGTSSPYSPLAVVQARQGNDVDKGAQLLMTTATTASDRLNLNFSMNGITTRARAGIGAVAEDAGGYACSLALYTRLANDGSGLLTTDEKVRITSAGNVGIGNIAPTGNLHIGNGTTIGEQNLYIQSDGANRPYLRLYGGTTNKLEIHIGSTANITTVSATDLVFSTNNTEKLRIESAGNVGIGTSSPATRLHVSNSVKAVLTVATTGVSPGAAIDLIGSTSHKNWSIGCSAVSVNGSLEFTPSTTNGGSTFTTPAVSIDFSSNLLVGRTTTWSGGGDNTVGIATVSSAGQLVVNATGNVNAFVVNNVDTDNNIISIRQANTEEGSISISGTTVSYNGGHLSRYAQTTITKDESIVKGTVLSNLDEMNVYTKNGQPVDNEQLNKVKVSDTEGDVNVAGVFVNWTFDDQHNVDEINMAMTGDMIIRIAQGTTVVRGNLLMSAGDGTAKPQGDDIVRSKTVAKVTSNHVTCTYADGSYCVPCVLMAC